MPELPEVHTIATDLNKHLAGYTIKEVLVANNYTVFPDRNAFISEIKGTQISNVRRIAKNIIIELSSKKTIVIHLAMTGRVLIRDPKQKTDKWVKVLWQVEKDNDTKHLRFADMRMFGKVRLVDDAGVTTVEEKYGPEIIDKNLTPEQFLTIIKSKKTNIKNVLLDQSLISGLGNIYATDALYMAKIHPETSTTQITLEMATKLLQTAQEIIHESIEHRGSTLPDKMYVDVFGNEGHHQDHFRIYMKDKCPICGSKVGFIKLNGRGTYFCPVCQNTTEAYSKQKKLL